MKQNRDDGQQMIRTVIYDKHSPSLYGLILKISENNQQAEEILIQSFERLFGQNRILQNGEHIFRDLLQHTVCIASTKTGFTKQNILKQMFKERHEKIPAANIA